MLQEALICLPQTAYSALHALNILLRSIRADSFLTNFPKETISALDEFLQLYEQTKSQRESFAGDSQIPSVNEQLGSNAQQPPIPGNSYRDYPVLPTLEELSSPARLCPLRPMRMKGAYANVFDYVDILYRVLREDFVTGFRLGFGEYFASLAGDRWTLVDGRRRRLRWQNIRLYRFSSSFLSSLL